MALHKILINGCWQEANAEAEFQAYNPTTGESLADTYPVSSWCDCDAALNAASQAFTEMRLISNVKVAEFLECYADNIENNSQALVEMANIETGLATSPRLADIEIPRTTGQLRQAAKAVREFSWTQPTIDTQNNIRSMFESLGPVVVFGPNNFPFAFGSISGGDFAAAIAAGNPVIAKAHPSHPGTTRLFAELAHIAIEKSGLPKGMVQMLYAMSNELGLKLVSDKRIAATGFTGSRNAGLALKQAADSAGKLIYLELSSINPTIILSSALEEKADSLVEEFTNSCVMAAGQLCTKPGLLVVPTGETGDGFIQALASRFDEAPIATLLSPTAAENICRTADELIGGGAQLLTQANQENSARFCNSNTLMSVSGSQYLANSELFQKEMFGNAALVIRSDSTEQTLNIIQTLEGNLTGCIYSHSEGKDDTAYQQIEPALRQKVGRILNDKMPTGVAVSAAMNHGGPFPAAGHPGFTAVGLPASIKRFAALKCYDGVREHRLPPVLANANPTGDVWRLIDGVWSTDNIAS
ncbi:aldehyde dehydrogenase (NADP(+)) [Aliikangiella sp. IMCC44359]|uniref:aldehyde dehydrogenase (NADP(+)) n=1 Tax=Aliikangiella sp. IMCC44359 TaxID=3459125 RepID=UPI00403B2697